MPLRTASGLPPEVEALAEAVVDSVGEVRKHCGRGLLESAYAGALAIELEARGIRFEREVFLPLRYKQALVPNAYRLDFWIERKLVLECKAKDELRPEDYAQVVTYLRLSGNRLGLLINFSAIPLSTGIKRVIV